MEEDNAELDRLLKKYDPQNIKPNYDYLFDNSKECFLVFSIQDYMCLSELGFNAIDIKGKKKEELKAILQSSKSSKKAMIYIMGKNPDDRNKEGFIIDNQAEDLKCEIENMDISCEIINTGDFSKETDFTGLYLKDKGKAKEGLEKELERKRTSFIEKASIAGEVEEYYKTFKNGDGKEAISTGFELFNQQLNGGLVDGFYVLGATPSLGKTTFILNMWDEMAKAGHIVLIFSLEMSKRELITRSISRLSYINMKREGKEKLEAVTQTDLTMNNRLLSMTEKREKSIMQAIASYYEYAKNIIINESVGQFSVEDVEEGIKRIISKTSKKPVVFIDYLQIMKSIDERMTDKQKTDFNVMRLKQLSRDYDLPIIAISSFNRDNYQEEANMGSFKESGSIEFSTDGLFAMQLKGRRVDNKRVCNYEEDIKKLPRQIQFKILKNRRGMIGNSLYFQYFPQYNYFEEVSKEEAIKDESLDEKARERLTRIRQAFKFKGSQELRINEIVEGLIATSSFKSVVKKKEEAGEYSAKWIHYLERNHYLRARKEGEALIYSLIREEEEGKEL